MITYDDLIKFSMLIVAIISLIVQIYEHKKIAARPRKRLFNVAYLRQPSNRYCSLFVYSYYHEFRSLSNKKLPGSLVSLNGS